MVCYLISDTLLLLLLLFITTLLLYTLTFDVC